MIGVIAAGAYYMHHQRQVNESSLQVQAGVSAYGIALGQGWLGGPANVVSNIVAGLNDTAPDFEILSDKVTNGVHTTTGKYRYTLKGNDTEQCRLMTFTWSKHKNEGHDRLISHSGC